MSVIQLHHITKNFEEEGHHVAALKDITLEVKQGEFLILLGPSGSGKSTLLRIMSQMIAPTQGKVVVDPAVKSSFIFQDFALFPWLNIEDNVGFGLKMHDVNEHERNKTVKAEIERMGLTGFEKSFPRELSGGMKQRVGIARALAMKPNLIFLDEPFSALDSFTANKLRKELLEIWQQENLTIVMVTHLIEEALQLGDRIAVLTQRPARVEHIFHNTLPRPRDLRSAKFFEMTDTINDVIKI